MKKTLLTLALAFSITPLFCQQKTTLPTTNKLIQNKVALANIYYSLSSVSSDNIIQAYSLHNLTDKALDSIILGKEAHQIVLAGDSIIHITRNQDPFLKIFTNNKSQISKTLKEIPFSGKMLSNDIISFAITNDIDTCISIGTFIYDKVFNTSRTNEKQRAKSVIHEIALPFAYKAYSNLKNSTFKDLIIICAYGKKDFSDKFVYSPESASLACLIDFKLLQKVVDLEITEDEMLEHIEIFLNDESDIKRIKLNM